MSQPSNNQSTNQQSNQPVIQSINLTNNNQTNVSPQSVGGQSASSQTNQLANQTTSQSNIQPTSLPVTQQSTNPANSLSNTPPTSQSTSQAPPPRPRVSWDNIEAIASELLNSRENPMARYKLVTAIKESLEITATPEYENWLRLMFPALSRSLAETKSGFTDSDVDHRVRQTILEIFRFLPQNESLRNYVKDLCSLTGKQLFIENEENGVLCCKIIYECHKNFGGVLASEISPFYSFVIALFDSFDKSCKLHFTEQFNQLYNHVSAKIMKKDQTVNLTGTTQSSSGPSNPESMLPPRQLAACVQSFKVANECIPVIVLLCHQHQQQHEQTMNQLIPLMIKMLQQIQNAPREPAPIPQSLLTLLNATSTESTDASTKNSATNQSNQPSGQSAQSTTEDANLLKSIIRERDSRFKVAQLDFSITLVKCLTLITNAARSIPLPSLNERAHELGGIVVLLLSYIPGDFVTQRREVLTTLRYMMAIDSIKKHLVRVRDKLLEEKLLTGEGRSSESLRPMVYQIMSDIVAPIKAELTPPQIHKLIFVFSRNLHDTTLPLSSQISAVKLLTQLSDPIHRIPDDANGRPGGRALSARILMTVVHKFETLQYFIPKMLSILASNHAKIQAKIEENTIKDADVVYPTIMSLPNPGSQQGRGVDDGSEDPAREVRNLLLSMIPLTKTVVWSLTAARMTPPGPPNPQARKHAIPLEEEEITLLCRLVDSGLRCLKFFSASVPPAPPAMMSSTSIDDNEKAAVEQFAGIFTHLEPRYFREVWSQRMDVLFAHLSDRQAFMHIPQQFLIGASTVATNSGSQTAKNHNTIATIFTDLLLSFSVKHIQQLSTPLSESPASQTLIYLLRLVFLSVENTENVLRPYLVPLVSNVVRLMQEAKYPINYLATLKNLFRSIGTNRFDQLYKELLATIPQLVHALTELQLRSSSVQTRDLATDLSLTLPARLSTLLQYMPILLRSVVRALQSKDDNVVKIGVRTLEFWIDNTNSSYLYPQIKPFLREFFTAICGLLKPSNQSPYGAQALFVLGKFGGRARRFLIEQQELQWKEETENGLTLDLRFVGHVDYFTLPLDSAIDEACKLIHQAPSTMSSAQSECLTHAYFFVRTCLLALCNLDGDADAVWTREGYKKYQAYNQEFKDQQAEIQRLRDEKREQKRRVALEEKLSRRKQARQDEKDREEAQKRIELGHPPQAPKAVDEAMDTAESDSERLTDEELKPPGDSPSLGEEEVRALRARVLGSATRSTLRQLIVGVMCGAADMTLFKSGVDSVAFVKGLSVHFACVAASARPRSAATEGRDIDASVFAEALTQCFEEDVVERREVAISAMRVFLQSLISLIGVQASSERSVVGELLTHVAHSCSMDRWESKSAGCAGLALLLELMPFEWIHSNQVDFIRGFFAALSHEKTENTEPTAEKAMECLKKIVTLICEKAMKQQLQNSESATAANQVVDPLAIPPAVTEKEKESSSLRHLITIIAPNLISPITPMRDASQQLLLLFSELTGRNLSEVLSPWRTSLFGSLTSKTLQQTPISARIGYISAVAFVLTSCQPPLVPAKDLPYLMRQVVDTVEGMPNVDSESVSGSQVVRAARGVLQTKLRVECIKLMTAAMMPHEGVQQESDAYNAAIAKHAEEAKEAARAQGKEVTDPTFTFSKPPENPHRDWKDRCLKVLFRAYTSRSRDVYTAARMGLQEAVTRDGRISKDIMQSTIRVILNNLTDHRKLTVPLLEGLGRLLNVLSSSFNTTLGETLIAHASHFSSVERISKMREDATNDQTGALVRLQPQEEIRIPLLILELFPALPTSGNEKTLIEQLTVLVMRLEEVLPQLHCHGLALLPSSLIVLPTPTPTLGPLEPSSKMNVGITSSSPYRLPLIKFMNKHPRRTVEFFLRYLSKRRYALFFTALLKYPEAEPLRQQILSETDSFLFWTFNYNRDAVDQLMKQQAALQAQQAAAAPVAQPSVAGVSNPSPAPTVDAQTHDSTASASGVSAAPSDQTAHGSASSQTVIDASGNSRNVTTNQFSLNVGPVGPAHGPPKESPWHDEWEERVMTGLNLTTVISSLKPEFIGARVLHALYELWESQSRIARLLNEQDLPLHHLDETRWLVQCFINYSRTHRQDVNVIWKMLSAFKLRSLTDFTFLSDYIEIEIATTWTIEEQNYLVKQCMRLCELPGSSISARTRVWRYVIRPLIKHNLSNRKPPSEEVRKAAQRARAEARLRQAEPTKTDAEIAEAVAALPEMDLPPVWQPGDLFDDDLLAMVLKNFETHNRNGPNVEDEYSIELLRVDSLLVNYMALECTASRGILVTFGWHFLKSDNPLTKACACVTVTRFIASQQFQTPDKFCSELYTQLLKASEPAQRPLFNKALDILIPALPLRIPVDPNIPGSGWIRVTRRLLLDDPGSAVTLHVYATILRHGRLFYPYRAVFASGLCTTLARLSSQISRSPEHRRLAVQLAELLVGWDKQALYDWNQQQAKLNSVATDHVSPSKRQATESNNVLSAPNAQSVNSQPSTAVADAPRVNPWPQIPSTGANVQQVESVLTFLARLALMSCESETRPFMRRLLKLNREACAVWKDTGVEVKLAYLEKLLASASATHDMSHLHGTCMELLVALFKHAPPSYIAQPVNAAFTDKLVMGSFQTKGLNQALKEGLCEVIGILLKAHPMTPEGDPATPEINRMYSKLRDIILQALKTVDQKSYGVYLYMELLRVIDEHAPWFVTQNITIVAKCMHRLVKDVQFKQQQLIAQAQAAHGRPVQYSGDDRMKQALATEAMKRCVTILFNHIPALGEQKKAFVVALSSIITTSNDFVMLNEICKQVDTWLHAQPEPTTQLSSGSASGSEGQNQNILSTKDKCSLLLKLASRERERGYGDVMTACLNTTLSIFKQTPRRTDIIPRLQRVFMQGLRCEDNVALRQQFRSILLDSLEPTLADRMFYVFVTEDWEVLSDCYWPTHALDLILDVIDKKQPLSAVKHTPKVPSFEYDPYTEDQDVSTLPSSPVSADIHPMEIDNQATGTGFNKIKDEGASRKRSHSSAFAPAPKPDKEQKEGDVKAVPSTPSQLLVVDFNRDAVIEVEKNWLATYGRPEVHDLLGSLRELCFYHIPISHSTFESVVPSAWAHLSAPQRDEMAPSVSGLLSKPWHGRYDYEGWNRMSERIHPVQTLLMAHRQLIPSVPVSPAVLRFAGRTFNAWHAVIDMLEATINQPTLTAPNAPQVTADTLTEEYDALCHMYRELNDEDMWCAATRRSCTNSVTHNALAFQQFGMWQKSQDTLFSAMAKHNAQQAATDGLNTSGISKREEVVWESEWVNAAKHLNQWEVIKDFSLHVGMNELVWDASWRLGDWQQLKELTQRYSQNAEFAQGRIFTIYHMLHERKSSPEEINQAVDAVIQQQSLREWQALPSVLSTAHLPALVKAQRLTELHESCSTLDMVIKSMNKPTPTGPSLKQHMVTWRDRTPCKWEEMTVWSDIMTWRAHLYGILSSSYNQPPETVGTVRLSDSAWTLIKLASAARHQKLGTTCLTTLAKLFTHNGPALTPDDSFNKLREHIQTCLQTPAEVNTALNIINSTNLDYFIPEQKAELFRLKGETLQHLGFGDESNAAFSAAISVCDTYSKGWLSWAQFCDKVYVLKRDGMWSENAMVCYIQSIAHFHKKAFPMIARILWLLASDSNKPDKDQNVVRTFQRFHEHIPLWIWILWTPQLITSLARSEGRTCKDILCKIGRAYPQAIYYSTRCSIVEKKDHWNSWNVQAKQRQAALEAQQKQAAASPAPVATDNGPASNGPAPMEVSSNTQTAQPAQPTTQPPAASQPTQTPQTTAAETAPSQPTSQSPSNPPPTDQPARPANSGPVQTLLPELLSYSLLDEVITIIRRSHPALCNEIERMVEEVNRRFRNEPEEDILQNFHVLIKQCHRAGVGDDVISPSFLATLERMYRQFFVDHALAISSTSLPRYMQFVANTRARFEFDFIPSSSPAAAAAFPTSLHSLLIRLYRWRAHIAYYCAAQPQLNRPRLEKSSSILTLATSNDIEIPGQYASDREPKTDRHIILSRFSVDVAIPGAATGVFARRIAMMGDDGKLAYFFVQPSAMHVSRCDERLLQFYVLLNRFLKLNKSSRSRHLACHLPILVHIHPRLRLMSTHPSAITFEDLYERSACAAGLDPQAPLMAYREALRAANPDLDLPTRLHVYQSVTTTLVPDTLLSSAISRSMPNLASLYALTQEFTRQTALTGYLSYILKIGDRTPNKLTLLRCSGRIVQHDFYYHHTDSMSADSSEAVPFRLTRNMQRFIGPTGIDGVLTSSIVAMNAVFSANQDWAKSYLSIFYRDDLLSHWSARASIDSDATQRHYERQTRERYLTLVNACLKRILYLVPPTHASSHDVNKKDAQAMTAKARQIVRWSTHKTRICQMPPTWYPWF